MENELETILTEDKPKISSKEYLAQALDKHTAFENVRELGQGDAMKPSYTMTQTCIFLSSGLALHYHDIWRISVKRGLFGFLREERLLVARLPDDYTDECRQRAWAVLAELRGKP